MCVKLRFMKTPKYVAKSGCPWQSWKLTTRNQVTEYINVGEPFYMNPCPKKELEAYYPGFMAAYDILEARGCDTYFLTAILKFCIVEANHETLDVFLTRSNMLASIGIALNLGLSGNETVTMLIREKNIVLSSTPPSDLLI